MGLRICVFSEFLGDIDVADSGLYFENYWIECFVRGGRLFCILGVYDIDCIAWVFVNIV